MKILFAGGGTGGHIMPIIAVERELRRLYPKDDLKLYYIGPKDKFWLLLLSKENIKTHAIISGKLRNYFSLQNIADIIFKMPLGFLQSFFLLLFIRPKLIFSKGGTGSLPVTFCAKILRIPVFLHESDTVPGRANKITSKWAKKIFTSFEKTAYFNLEKTVLAGNPIRKEITEGTIDAAKEMFNLTLQKPIILFLGGSQGAEPINNFVLLILNEILKNYELIHVSGIKNYKKTQAESEVILNFEKDLKIYYHLYESLNEVQLTNAYFASSLIVSRSGSGSIFEIAASGKPSILIPLQSAASDHQSKNAYQYSQSGAAIVVEQQNLTPGFFMGKINYLFSQPEKMEKMKEAALGFSKPMAAKAIANEILQYLNVN